MSVFVHDPEFKSFEIAQHLDLVLGVDGLSGPRHDKEGFLVVLLLNQRFYARPEVFVQSCQLIITGGKIGQ